MALVLTFCNFTPNLDTDEPGDVYIRAHTLIDASAGLDGGLIRLRVLPQVDLELFYNGSQDKNELPVVTTFQESSAELLDTCADFSQRNF